MSSTVLVRSGDLHCRDVEGAAQSFRKKFEHLLGDPVEGGGLVRVHPLEQGAKGVVVALIGKLPRRAVAARKLGPAGLT